VEWPRALRGYDWTMRAGVAAFTLGTALLIVSGCTSHRTVANGTVASQPGPQHLALISVRTGAPQRGFPDLPLSTAVSDGHNGWFVGRTVSVPGGSRPAGLAHLYRDGSFDPAWGTRLSRNVAVCRLIRSGSRLYVEGSDRVEAFDARTGARLWTGPRVTPKQSGICGGSVPALAASSTRVYVGGNFTGVGGLPRRSLAALDAHTGRLLDWRAPPLRNGVDPIHYVTALAFNNSRLYVGGVFTTVAGHPRYNLAALDPRTGALLTWKRASGGDTNGGDVDTILVTHGEVITAGHDGFGATDTHTGRSLTWTSRLGGLASTFAAYGPLVYLGGDLRYSLRSVAGHRRNNLAALNLATGHFTTWRPNLAPYVSVGSIVPAGDKVLVIGAFTTTVG
jgi:hypothetical protein